MMGHPDGGLWTGKSPARPGPDGAYVVTDHPVAERLGSVILLPQGDAAQAQEAQSGQDKRGGLGDGAGFHEGQHNILAPVGEENRGFIRDLRALGLKKAAKLVS